MHTNYVQSCTHEMGFPSRGFIPWRQHPRGAHVPTDDTKRWCRISTYNVVYYIKLNGQIVYIGETSTGGRRIATSLALAAFKLSRYQHDLDFHYREASPDTTMRKRQEIKEIMAHKPYLNHEWR